MIENNLLKFEIRKPWEVSSFSISENSKQIAKKLLERIRSERPFWIKAEKIFVLSEDLERLSRGEKIYYTEHEKSIIEKKLQALEFFLNQIKKVDEKEFSIFDFRIRFLKSEFDIRRDFLFEVAQNLSRCFGLRKLKRKRLFRLNERTILIDRADFGQDLVVLSLIFATKKFILVENDQKKIKFLKRLIRLNQPLKTKIVSSISEVSDSELNDIEMIVLRNCGREHEKVNDYSEILKRNKPITIAYIDRSIDSFFETPKTLKRIIPSYRLKMIELDIDPLKSKIIIAL